MALVEDEPRRETRDKKAVPGRRRRWWYSGEPNFGSKRRLLERTGATIPTVLISSMLNTSAMPPKVAHEESVQASSEAEAFSDRSNWCASNGIANFQGCEAM